MATNLSSFNLSWAPNGNKGGVHEAPNGNLYFVARDSGALTQCRMIRSTDDGDTWSVMDSGNQIGEPTSFGANIGAIDSIMDGDIIHIGFQYGESGANGLWWGEFDTSTDTWGASTDLGNAPWASTQIGTSVGIRTAGSTIFMVAGTEEDAVMGTAYSRLAVTQSTDGGSTWTSPDSESSTVNDSSLEVYFTGADLVFDGDSHFHVIYSTFEDGQVWVTEYSDFETPVNGFGNAAGSTDTGNTVHRVAGADYDPDADEIRAAFTSSTDNALSELSYPAGDPASLSVDNALADNTQYINSTADGVPVGDLRYDRTNNEWVVLYADNSTQDLWKATAPSGGSWGTDEEILGAATINWVTFRVSSAGSYLTVYDNGGTLFYETFGIIQKADTDASGTGAEDVAIAAPRNITAVEQSSSEIQIDWDIIVGADDYDLERSGPSTTVIKNVGDPPYTDTGLDQGTTYDYRVRSVKVVT